MLCVCMYSIDMVHCIGKVESTETIYKYRMQVKEGEERSNLGSTSEQDSQDQHEGSDSNESGSASNDDDKEEEEEQ